MRQRLFPVKVEIEYRWLLLLVSLVIMFLLRSHTTALVAYVIGATIAIVAWLVFIPKWLEVTERKFQADLLRHLAGGRWEAAQAVIGRQRLLRWSKKRFLVAQAEGLLSAARGEFTTAQSHLNLALTQAPERRRLQIELNLARTERALGAYDLAEARYRSILERHPEDGMATTGLAELTAERTGRFE